MLCRASGETPSKSTAPKSTTQRVAYDWLAEGFGPGLNGPFIVTAETAQPGDNAAVAQLAGALDHHLGAVTDEMGQVVIADRLEADRADRVIEALNEIGMGIEKRAIEIDGTCMDETALRLAYMDVAPTAAANGRTVVLFHGRNFPGSYWAPVIKGLAAEGYRVVAPDQIHFGKSSKPDDLPVNFDVMAAHTAALLDHLKVGQVDIVAHSMGGMAGTRFTRTYPQRVNKLVLVGPVGLEDYRQYVPLVPRERLIEQEMALTPEQYYNQLRTVYNPQLTREQFYP